MRNSADILYDLIVIGGGITGAGVARDAALRGLSVLLLEKGDYSSGVSSKTTRLVHGGLRYLANFELDLVAEALRERAIIRRLAPYLVRPMPILIPIYRQDPHGRAAISVGIHLYELLTRESDIPHYFTAGAVPTLSLEPCLNREGLKGSALFYDHQIIMPERLVFENLLSAREAGALVRNYAQADRVEERGDGFAVTVRDVLTGGTSTASARAVVNAGGPWVDRVRHAAGIDRARIIHPTKGVHLVVPPLCKRALFVSSRDGRMFFIMPFDGCSLIGTTDTVYDGDLDDVHANAQDVDYLLRESRRVLPGMNITRESILYTYAGIRPLAFSGERESSISRKHRVIREGSSGRFITIAGGKYTTYRNMAQDTVDAVCRSLRIKTPCATDRAPLAGSLPAGYDEYLREAVPDMASRYGADAETVRHLVGFYGARAEQILRITKEDRRLAARISADSRDICAQVVYSVREEGARTLSDILLRRIRLGITATRGLPQAAKIAGIVAGELGWNAEEQEQRIGELERDVRRELMFSGRDSPWRSS